MVVVTLAGTPASSLLPRPQPSPHPYPTSHYDAVCKRYPPCLVYLRQLYRRPRYRGRASESIGVLPVRAYMEEGNSISAFTNKVIGSLPVVGLVARILSDEGGVGSDIIDFAEFRRRVGKKCTITDSRAFYEFQDRRGRSGNPLYVLLCCWLAAVGAGLLKSEEILEGVERLRISNDIEFEEENLLSMMNEAKEVFLYPVYSITARSLASVSQKTKTLSSSFNSMATNL